MKKTGHEKSRDTVPLMGIRRYGRCCLRVQLIKVSPNEVVPISVAEPDPSGSVSFFGTWIRSRGCRIRIRKLL
jgi:hypothetical protein